MTYIHTARVTFEIYSKNVIPVTQRQWVTRIRFSDSGPPLACRISDANPLSETMLLRNKFEIECNNLHSRKCVCKIADILPRLEYDNTNEYLSLITICSKSHKIYTLLYCCFLLLSAFLVHYDDIIMGVMASQITSLTIVYSTVYSGAMDNWENMPYLTHTLEKLYLTGILWVQCLQISLHNDDNEMV